MALFLVTALPVSYLLLLSLGGDTFEGNTRRALFFIRSFFIALPVYIGFLLLQKTLPMHYTAGLIYGRYLFIDVLLFFIPGILVYFLFRRFSLFHEYLEDIAGAFSVFAGILSLASFIDGITYFGNYDAYILFVRPCMRIGLSLALSVVLTMNGPYSPYSRLSMYGMAAILALLLPCVPLFYYMNYRLLMYVAGGVCIAISAFCIVYRINTGMSLSKGPAQVGVQDDGD